jgi:hypothetical protein
LFARRTRNDVNAAFQNIVLVHEHEIGFAAAKNFREHRAKILPNLFERLGEHLPCLDVDAADDLKQLGLGLNQIVVLLAQELITLFGFLVFLDGDQIDRPHFIQSLLQRFDLFGDGGPIGRNTGLGHLFGRRHVDLRRAFVGKCDRDALAANVIQVNVILLLNALTKALNGHILLGQLNIERSTLFLQRGQAPALFTQVFFARCDFGIARLLLREQFRRLGIHLFALVAQGFDTSARLLNLGFGLGFAIHAVGNLTASLLGDLPELVNALLDCFLLLPKGRAQLLLAGQRDLVFRERRVGSVTLLA